MRLIDSQLYKIIYNWNFVYSIMYNGKSITTWNDNGSACGYR